MWFGKSKKDAGARRPAARGEAGALARKLALPKAAWIPLAGLAAVALAAGLVWKTGEILFWGNPHFTIKTLDIRIDGPSITPAHVREYMTVREGRNLFEGNLRALRDEFLRKTPIARSATLRRKLPDTLVIEIVERTPIARLGRWQSMAVDRDGYVFNLRTSARELPVISGCAESNLKPGTRVDQAVLNAIEVVDASNRTKAGEQIRIATLDVSPKEHIELYLAAGERIRIAWPEMDHTSSLARQQVERKLAILAGALRASEERGKKLVNLDLTFGDQYVPGQEY